MAEEVLAEAHGFSIVRRDAAVVLVDRRTRSAALLAAMGGGLCGLLGLVAAIQLLGGTTPANRVGAGVAAVLAAGTGWLAVRGLRMYRARRDGPGVRLVLSDGWLRGEDGQPLAPLSSLTLRTSIDWTDGTGGLRLARRVHLRWPGGCRTVFKSFDQAEVKRVCALLADAGIR
ncbi:MAG: hypothetical protein RMK29_19865 [Myxococcales bacterium]|nr:hypothetical protein [Myxococcota bacterium]MDW8283966.1 hypothetical protein [Myxococcales bacterium]